MADIFISYSSQDKTQAADLCSRLNAAGFSCWIDQSGIGAASQWSSEIVKAIGECKVFIILLSNHSLASQNVVNELLLAFEDRKCLIPILLEPVKLSPQVKYQLAGLQQVSYKDYDRIEKAIRGFTGSDQRAPQPSQEMHRHLLAVMFTDIQGFSLLMNTDESLGMETLHFHNDFMRKTIESSEGRVVEIIGDGILSVFESAVRAVEAGIAIQEGLKEHNMALPEEHRFLVRVGIHMGDIIEESGGVKGDAVNISSRIQAIAPGGGIAVSETVYDSVKHKMALYAISLGAKKLKNIQDLYTIYMISRSTGITPMSHTGSQDTHATDDIRRLAVLPFDDLSPNHDNEWFADGLTDELITTLNKLDQVFVLDRLSSKEYKNSKLNSKQIAQEIQVRYIINGAVRKQEKNIRIQAALIDTETGKTLWDEKFSGTMDDIFEIQEKTARDITDGLKLKLTPEEVKEIKKKSTTNAEAYELHLKGREYYNRYTKSDYERALLLYDEAVSIDPNYAAAYADIAQTCQEIYRNYSRIPEWLDRAEAAVEKVREIDGETAQYFRELSNIALRRGDAESALRFAKRTVEMNPDLLQVMMLLDLRIKRLGTWRKQYGPGNEMLVCARIIQALI